VVQPRGGDELDDVLLLHMNMYDGDVHSISRRLSSI
jgi:hypothetical protein